MCRDSSNYIETLILEPTNHVLALSDSKVMIVIIKSKSPDAYDGFAVLSKNWQSELSNEE